MYKKILFLVIALYYVIIESFFAEKIFQELNEKDSKSNVLELLKSLTLEKSFVNHSKGNNSSYITGVFELGFRFLQTQTMQQIVVKYVFWLLSIKKGDKQLAAAKNVCHPTNPTCRCNV